MLFPQFCQLRRSVFDQSSPVQPVSESRGGPLSVTEEQKKEIKKIRKNKKKSQKYPQKSITNPFFFKKLSDNLENIFFRQKNYILLVLPIEEISLRPELSTPPRFRIQGGQPECDTRKKEDGLKLFCLIINQTAQPHWTKGQQKQKDKGTKLQRDQGTMGQWDKGTKGQSDNGTMGQ